MTLAAVLLMIGAAFALQNRLGRHARGRPVRVRSRFPGSRRR